MIERPLAIAALAALALAAASPVTAGSPCCCGSPCVAAPTMLYQPYELPRVYIVNQGPVYSGAGIFTRPEIVVPKPMAYPYVQHDFPVYRDAYAPMPQYRHVRSVPRGTLRRPPGWFDK